MKRNAVTSDETVEKAGSFGLGCTVVDIREAFRSWTGSSESGVYIARIKPDSFAEQCGLQLGDLIFEVDGIPWAEDPYCILRGRAKAADGETVVFRVLREGRVVDLEIHK